MVKSKTRKITGDYEAWFINSLRNKKEASAYLQVALEEYEKNNDDEALFLAWHHIMVARNSMSNFKG